MNYVNLTNNQWVFHSQWLEVDFYEECRIDAIIANIDDICAEQQRDTINRGGDSVLARILELCSIGGIQFVLLETSEDILYSDSNELQEVILEIQRSTHYFYEIRYIDYQIDKEKRVKNQFVTIFCPSTNLVFDTSDFGYPNFIPKDDKIKARDFVCSKIIKHIL